MFVPEGADTYKVYEQKNAIQKDSTLGTYYISTEHFERLKAFEVQPNDIIVSCAGTIGETYVLPKDIKRGVINQALMYVRLYLPIIAPFYLIYFDFIIKSSSQQDSKGTAIKNIPPFETLKNYLFPLPPLQEQARIIDEIEKWFTLIDTIEDSKRDLQEIIKATKSKVLNLAIHGKLVSQDPADEPIAELLKRIAPHATPCDTSHYENLPASWCVCKVETIADVISGVSYDKSDVQRSGIKILRGGNIQDGKIVEQDDDVYISEKYINESNSIKYGDIILVASTGSQTLIGKTGFAPKAYHHTQIGAFLRIIRAKDSSLCEYLNYVFLSDTFRKHIRELASGTNINNVKNKYITDFILALPPQNEIPRIIKKVNDIFKSLDTITAEL